MSYRAINIAVYIYLIEMKNANSDLNDYMTTITIINDNNLYWQINGVE
jgi:hypothetical protein